jgi:phosphatidate phosphatase APP1
VSDRSRGLSGILSNVLAIGSAARDVILQRLPRAAKSISLYDGFGAHGRVLIQGRVLREEPVAPATAEDTRWRNLVATLRRADADPLPYATVRIHVGRSSQEIVADDEGFFTGWMSAEDPERIDDEWVRMRAELVPGADGGGGGGGGGGGAAAVHGSGRALMPVAAPEFLVISDIDDTVLQSKVTNLVLAAQTIAFGNARTRLPFPGVAAFYHALRRGPKGKGRNPLFYVSSSPWNLYDVIRQFLDIQEIPSGPIMLRDLDLGLDTLSSRHHHVHKREMIRRVLSTYPESPAILIGDSGQQDPEIYRDVVREYAGRIKAVYIRNVTMNDERSRAIHLLAEEIVQAGSSLVLADDTLAAARHAVEQGFIATEALASIGEEKRADEGVTQEKHDAPGARDTDDTPTPTVVVENRQTK